MIFRSLPAGEVATLELRLVNDDSDTTTSVHISDVHVQTGTLPVGGTTGPVGVLSAVTPATGSPVNPSNPTATIISSGASADEPVTATSHGPSVPSTTLALTAAGKAAGFSLTTFVTGFHDIIGFGPVGVGFFDNGTVAVSDSDNGLRVFPNDNDGQNVGGAINLVSYPGGTDGIAQVGTHVYMAQDPGGNIVELNSDGTTKQTIASGLGEALALTASPDGHLFVSTRGAAIIWEIDPIAKTMTQFATNVFVDGLTVSPDGKTLYAAGGGNILGFNTATGAQVYTSGSLDGPDGIAVGTGALAGNIYVNTTNGNVVQINLTTGVQTFVCTGGSRGDLVNVDPTDGSLLLTQTDRVLRLTPAAGGGFGVQPEVQVTASSPQSQVDPGSTVLISGHASTTGITAASPAFHGGFVPSTTMQLTAAGKAGGYTLTTFATGFPFSASGPIGWALLPNGNVMVSDVGGNVRIFPNNNDGQTTAGAVITQNYGSGNGDGIAQVGQHIYMALQASGSVIEVNPNGSFNQTIVTGLGSATGLVAAPSGLLYVSDLSGAVSVIDPIAKTKSTFAAIGADGLAVSPDGLTLYAKSGSDILGYDIASKTKVFDSGGIPATPDGMAIGVGTLAGNIFVNCNDGTLVQVNIATKAQTLLASSGSRGDLVAIDPSDGSLLLTQTDRILRLTPPPGGAFGNPKPSTIKTVTVNGVPVDALDANGDFFANVTVQPGQNNYAVTAIDSRGMSASVSLSINGVFSGNNQITSVVDLSGSLAPAFGRTSLNETTGDLFTQVAAVNTGQFAVNTPLFVGVTHLSDPTVTVLNPDGYTDTGVPYFNYSSLVSGNHLESGAQTGFRELAFSNPDKTQFTFDLVPLGQLNAAPQISSVPRLDAAASQPYTYAVAAADPDHDPLTYALLTAPSGMTINPSSGLISYSPAPAAIGLQDVLINVSDGRGGSAQQHYELNVIATLPNRPPVFTTTPLVDATAGHVYSYQAQAVDPDGDPLTYSLIVPSSDQSPRAIPIVNPGFEQHVLGDGSVTAGTEPGWTILSGSAGDYNPTTGSFPTIPEGQNVSFSNGSTISQVLSAFTIAGASYSLQAQVGWPLSLPFGGYAVQLWAGGVMLGQATSPVPTQGNFTTATVDVTIAANGPNVGKQLEIRLVGNGVQVEFDAVGLTMTPEPPPPEGVPVGASIDPQTGVLTWTPAVTDIGVRRITIQADDGRGGLTTQVYKVNTAADNAVPPGNHPPIITSTPITQAYPEEAYAYHVRAVDPDNDPLTYSLVIGPTGMAIDPTTGLLTWPVQTLAFATNPVTVSVSDGNGGVTQQIFTVSEVHPLSHTSPSIVSTPPITAEPNKLYLYQVQAITPDPVALNYSLSTSPAGMTIDATGLIRWTPTPADLGQTRPVTISVVEASGEPAIQSFGITVVSQSLNHSPVISSIPPDVATVGNLYRYDAVGTDPDHDYLIWSLDSAPVGMGVDNSTGTIVWKPQANQTGPQNVVLHLSDGHGGELTQDFTINVNSVNRPPGITSAPPTSATIGSTYIYNVHGVDPDGDLISYSLPNAPAGMTINALTGVITWTPVLGTFPVDIEVVDSSGAFADQVYSVVAQPSPLNKPPTITSTPVFSAEPLKPYTYALTATDPDGDAIHYALLNGPAGMTIDASTGAVSWTPTAAQVGAFAVSVAALDTSNASGTQSFQVVTGTNHAPTITSQPKLAVTAGLSYHYAVVATDPDNDPLTYRLSSAPAGMTVDSFGNISWLPGAGDVGLPAVQVTVSDPDGATATQSFNIAVNADTGAPQVQILTDRSSVNIGDVVNIRVATSDDTVVVNKTLIVDGAHITLDANGSAAVKFTHAGFITMTATATDSAGNVGNASSSEQVIDPTDTSAPEVAITSPGDGDTITSPVDILGTVNDPQLLFYTLSIAPTDGSSDFKQIFRGTSNVINGKLGTLDPTMLANDSYILRLDAVNAGGNENEIDIQLNVAGTLKLGNFTLSFTDLKTTVSGIPITVSRTYDTLNSTSQGDFGYGWRLEFGNTQLRTSVPASPLADAGVYNAFVPGTRVYVTLPGGTREGFTFSASTAPGIKGSILGIVNPGFAADPGVTDTLSVAPADLYYFPDSGQFEDYTGDLPYNPADPAFGGTYTLTTKDGTAYQIDANSGSMLSVSNRNGNSLTYSSDGIKSSSGVNVAFERDAKGRIIGVVDPSGNKITYQYDAAGDLASVTDRNGGVTRFSYLTDPAHYLQQVIDPLGHTALSSSYGPDGRLTGITNGDGKTNHVSFDSANSLQRVTDALGNTTVYGYDALGDVTLEIAPDGGTTKFTYDPNGNMLSETDPDGHVTSSTYTTNGNVLSETDANGKITAYSYNALNEQLSATDALGNTTTNTYDQSGNLGTTQDPAGSTRTLGHDQNGQLTSLTDAAGQTTTYQYDADGRITLKVDALGTPTAYTYDANGNLLKTMTVLTTPGGVRTLGDDQHLRCRGQRAFHHRSRRARHVL